MQRRSLTGTAACRSEKADGLVDPSDRHGHGKVPAQMWALGPGADVGAGSWRRCGFESPTAACVVAAAHSRRDRDEPPRRGRLAAEYAALVRTLATSAEPFVSPMVTQ